MDEKVRKMIKAANKRHKRRTIKRIKTEQYKLNRKGGK